ncbi:VC0807 family protein [Streptomyces sp. NPDC057743]|uniref:VC0807 family protein n=1 Tax=Streptomyces sp. NPDC057743 TaxID=3346236 RepID=UPI0036CAADFA
MTSVRTGGAHPLRAVGVSLTVNLVLPLGLYYVLRAQGVAQWQALLLSGAVPTVHALGAAVVRRRVEIFDLVVAGLLAVSAGLSAINGSPRVMLLKDVAIPVVLGLWILGTLLAARPFAFHFGSRLRGAGGEADADRAWRERPEFRGALRVLTILWGGSQMLDAALSAVAACTLPVDVVPVIGRFQSLGILAVVVALTVRRSRVFRRRYGFPLFGGVRAPVGEGAVTSGTGTGTADGQARAAGDAVRA